MERAFCILLAIILNFPANAWGRPKKLVAIDAECDELKLEFREAVPFFFSGPDPWVELDELPTAFPDDALASLYTEGPKIRWVVLQLKGPRNEWFQLVNYFFDRNDQIIKRERHFEQPLANVALDERRYYRAGELLKQEQHYHPLGSGKKDLSLLDDVDAPEYFDSRELPFPKVSNAWRTLADLSDAKPLRQRLIDIPQQVVQIFQPY